MVAEVSGVPFSETVSRAGGMPPDTRLGVFMPARGVRLSSLPSAKLLTATARSGIEADDLFCEILGAAASVSAFRLGRLEFLVAEGGGDVKRGETGHRGMALRVLGS